MSVPAPRRPSHADGRWETIRYALDSNARTFRLCLILLVTVIPPIATAVVAVLIHHMLLHDRRPGTLTSLAPGITRLDLNLSRGLDDVGGSGRPEGHAFLSYVREDAIAVARLQHALEASGIPVWRDTANLWPGEDWRVKIRSAISDNALVFIACFSRHSLAREKSYQNEELVLAIEQFRSRRPDIPWLIPVRFDDCEIPDRDIGAGRTLTSIHCADLFNEHFIEGTERLIAAIRRIPGHSFTTRTAAQSPPSTESPTIRQAHAVWPTYYHGISSDCPVPDEIELPHRPRPLTFAEHVAERRKANADEAARVEAALASEKEREEKTEQYFERNADRIRSFAREAAAFLRRNKIMPFVVQDANNNNYEPRHRRYELWLACYAGHLSGRKRPICLISPDGRSSHRYDCVGFDKAGNIYAVSSFNGRQFEASKVTDHTRFAAPPRDWHDSLYSNIVPMFTEATFSAWREFFADAAAQNLLLKGHRMKFFRD